MRNPDDAVVAAVVDDVRDLDTDGIREYAKDTIKQLVFDVGALTCLLGPRFAWDTLEDIRNHMMQNPNTYNRMALTAREIAEINKLENSGDIEAMGYGA